MGGIVMSERPSTWGLLPEDGTTLTTAEYLKTAESVRVQELIYGRLRVEDSPTPMHQALLLRLAMILDEHARNNKVGSVWIAPLDVILDASRALVMQPDLFFVSNQRAEIISDHVWGAPDMVLEVVSPHPRIGKIEERIATFGQYGVRECWVVHQLLREIEILELTNLGAIARRRCRPGDQLRSKVLPTFHYTAGQLAGWE
jgi:Uma2 family endonuclease